MKRDIQKVDDDIIRKKRLIEQILYSDEDIIEILDNPNLSPDAPEEYVGENIFGFLPSSFRRLDTISQSQKLILCSCF